MTTIRELVGYMVGAGDPDVQVAEELYQLAKQWPPYERAHTPRERVIADVVSGGLDAALLALGIYGFDEGGEHWMSVERPESEAAFRQMMSQAARTGLQLAKAFAGQHDLNDPQFHTEASDAGRLALGRIDNAVSFLDVIVGAEDDDTAECHWWEVLGLDPENLP